MEERERERIRKKLKGKRESTGRTRVTPSHFLFSSSVAALPFSGEFVAVRPPQDASLGTA
ncbi:hypothetical protein RchiOBHm_Chr0c31g0501401 [Rosa chinensis]|uniref:Uncharacterized protein n=1 Tax=Rosa chinensis TaxID=74649 RepID=A0A2P6SQ96_ROSCH|nr:hypothetical protein RchiOBHm_Chr7g0204621 [Rosa chinensis]PRQ60869.1 hypothetical protein RchiOBHm_Chr0c31g0501401 [Rosa chinensis]